MTRISLTAAALNGNGIIEKSLKRYYEKYQCQVSTSNAVIGITPKHYQKWKYTIRRASENSFIKWMKGNDVNLLTFRWNGISICHLSYDAFSCSRRSSWKSEMRVLTIWKHFDDSLGKIIRKRRINATYYNEIIDINIKLSVSEALKKSEIKI